MHIIKIKTAQTSEKKVQNKTPKNRHHVIKVTLNNDELEKLNQRRGSTPKATYLRKSALSPLCKSKSKSNTLSLAKQRDLYIALSRIGNNINQITKKVNMTFTDSKNVIAHAKLLKELNAINAKLDALWQINKGAK